MHLTRYDLAENPMPPRIDGDISDVFNGPLERALRKMLGGKLVVRARPLKALATYLEFRVERDDISINGHIRQAGRDQAAAALSDFAELLVVFAERVGKRPRWVELLAPDPALVAPAAA